MAASETSIANRALQHLGSSRIESLSEDSPNGRSVDAAYEFVRDRLLRRYNWNFAIGRASVAADAAKTVYGDLNRFPLPNDFLKLLRNKETSLEDFRHDWQIEGGFIVTDDSSPLEFRYIRRITDVAKFDVSFRELLAAWLAHEICEEVTGDLAKRKDLREIIADALLDARQANAFENDADEPLEDDWLIARR